jgi:predicted nucleotidyltransferase component of viral defense system
MLDIATHKDILLQVLRDIYSDETIGPFLGFKGGTAAYLFYGLDRFSVDLDFDLLDAGKKEYVFGRIKEIIQKYGIIKDARIKRFNLFFLLSYRNKQKDAQNVKIEINHRGFDSRYEVKSYMGIPMKVAIQEYMFACKLVAMYDRLGKTNRDIYDVWFFKKNMWAINKEIVEKKSGMIYADLLEKSVAKLEKFNNKDILNGLGELLNNKQKDWVRAHLLEETIFSLKLLIETAK